MQYLFPQVVNYLLMKGADPNFPLGRGVATALCSLTTHTAHKRRNSKATFMMVGLVMHVHFYYAAKFVGCPHFYQRWDKYCYMCILDCWTGMNFHRY